ncbi:MAG TPA: UDP-N-acetylglucosamine 1-carboxyvinyltransferase, partial [Ruminococcus sp.]|nr:UDP-N-acetylglucosamine 1-carboxyvinyltransferase [Ruminococcus sp.]
RILEEMGAVVTNIGKDAYRIDPTPINKCCVPYETARKMRASYYFLGALLGKFKKARVSMPGGCPLGDRPIDQHLKAFSALGAKYTLSQGMIDLSADSLKGSQIFFDVVTVGATMNAMLAAVKADGLTIIENAAKEPHIVDLANFLNSMGANIMGAGTDVIKIRGVEHLHGTSYAVIPDQIEAGTFMIAAAATKGDVLIKNIIPKHLESITKKLEKIGVNIEQYDDSMRVWVDGPLVKANVKTTPHPGFPTDMQPQIATLLTLAEGTSIVTEGVWEQRFRYVDELRRMGADITVNGKVALIEGTGKLMGAPVKACDLRAGAALIIAGLAASGITEIEDIFHIERGYDCMEGKLRALGADIEKVSVPDKA